MQVIPCDADMTLLVPHARRDDSRTRLLDLTAAALEEPDAHMERARLETRGFVTAYVRCWVWDEGADPPASPHPASAYVTVYELGSATQARLAVADLRETLRAAGASDLSDTSTKVPPEGTVLRAYIDDDMGDRSSIATSAMGQFHVLSIVTAPSSAPHGSAMQAFPDGSAIAVALAETVKARAAEVLTTAPPR
jgi:hypothetical protein